jgi:hypothetical protein
MSPDALLRALFPRDTDALARRLLLAEALQRPLALRRAPRGPRQRPPHEPPRDDEAPQ